MIARLVRMRVRPEDIAEVVERYNDVIVPVAQAEEGFLGALLLTRPDGTIVSVDLCESVEQARSNEQHGIYQQEVSRFRDRLVDHPTREFYEVAAEIGLRGGTDLLPADRG